MAEVTRDAVMAYLTALGPSELRELILELRNRWDIEELYTGPSRVTMGAPVTMGMPIHDWHWTPAIEVVLLTAGERRVQVMKAIREALPLGLQETVALVDQVPSVLTRELPSLRAEVFKQELESLGAKVELRTAEDRWPRSG